jgi:hypothetical protein
VQNILTAPTPDALWQKLLEYKYTHLLVYATIKDFNGPETNRPVIYSPNFINRFLLLEQTHNGVYLFKVRRPNEATMNWDSNSNLLDIACPEYFKNLNSNCTTPISSGDTYLLMASIRSDSPDTVITTTIQWLDDSGHFIDGYGTTLRHWPGQDFGLFFHAETAPRRARAAVISGNSSQPVVINNLKFIKLTTN